MKVDSAPLPSVPIVSSVVSVASDPRDDAKSRTPTLDPNTPMASIMEPLRGYTYAPMVQVMEPSRGAVFGWRDGGASELRCWKKQGF